MSVELRHLRYFLALAEAKSFGRAAAALGIAQPALSQQIRKLEGELDVVLFVRGNDGSHLTAAGRAFVPGAQATVDTAAEAIALARRVGAGKTGRLRLGFVGSSADSAIPAALRIFRSERPDVEVSLDEIQIVDQSGSFEREEVDVAVMRSPVEDVSLMAEPIIVDGVLAVLPDGHALSERETIDFVELADETWVLVEESISPAARKAFLDLCADAGFTPTIGAEASTVDALVALVASGAGVTTLPAPSQAAARSGVCTVPIQGQESTVVMVWREDRRTPLTSAFMRLLRELAARPDPPPGPTST